MTWQGSGVHSEAGGSGGHGAPSRSRSQLEAEMSSGRWPRMMLPVSVARVMVLFTSWKLVLSVTSLLVL